MQHYAALILGIVGAALGGELFVRATVALARWARVSAGVIAVTVAAFGTSSPELSIAVGSALAGQPEISLGDALGSNVVNIALILGSALLISAISTRPGGLHRDIPVALLVPVVTAVLGADGVLSRLDGSLLLTAFGAWLLATVITARRQRSEDGSPAHERPLGSTIVLFGVGLALLIGGARLIVGGATGVAAYFGIDAFVIGATVVAVGTSVPELATTLVSRIRGHDEVGLGTILGSNIFNGLFIIGLAACIHPIVVSRAAFGALAFGIVAVVCCLPRRTGLIGRSRAAPLLAIYAAYVATVLLARDWPP